MEKDVLKRENFHAQFLFLVTELLSSLKASD